MKAWYLRELSDTAAAAMHWHMQIHDAVLPRKFEVSTHEFLNWLCPATATEGLLDAASGGGCH